MAGHYPLSRFEEPKLFDFIEKFKSKLNASGKLIKPFCRVEVPFLSKQYQVMPLSKDYVENKTDDFAFMVGRVDLESITDEHPSLTKGIDVEVHIEVKDDDIVVKNIFWVA
jgi:hypothetical protein